MAVLISTVRSELQIQEALISDASILYAIGCISDNTDLNLVCAKVIELLINRYRGRTYIKTGPSSESIDIGELKALRKKYLASSASSSFGAPDKGYDDPAFTRDGL